MHDAWEIRAPVASDVAFLRSSWLSSYRMHAAWTPPPEIYWPTHGRLIARLVGAGDAVVVCSREDPEQIIGYAVGNTGSGVLHYVYIKPPFRRLGVASALVQTMGVGTRHMYASHWTNVCHNAKLASRWCLTYNPYVLFDGLVEAGPVA